MRCAIYARVSTTDKGQDPENQMIQMREFAARMNWAIVGEYVDHVSGGKSRQTDNFGLMFEDAAKRRFDVVLFWALDRFSREGALPTLLHLDKLVSRGVAYRSFTEQYIDSAGIFGDAIISLLATLAKQERLRISERVKAGMNRARAKGKVFGRKSVVFDKQLARELRASGSSWRTVSRELNVPVATLHRHLSW